MKVLVTGGTGVVGDPAVRALLARGHSVRLFSRQAEHEAAGFEGGIEAHPGSISDAASVTGAAEGCDAVLHIAGIVAEDPPETTFERVNVQGTRNMAVEAERAGARRFVYVSSLGAPRGGSDYHRSKRRAEEETKRFMGAWTIVRPGNVYGPGDEVISLILNMVRTLPAVPVIGDGTQRFQPIDANDLGEALAQTVERDDLAGRVIDLAGADVTSMNDLLDRLERITDRSPARVPLPAALTGAGIKLAEMVGMSLPVNADQIKMLEDGSLLPQTEPNALESLFGITPTPLDVGLRRLADSLPEQLPKEGIGRLTRRRYWADIQLCAFSPEELFAIVRRDFDQLTPDATLSAHAEPGARRVLEQGNTLTLELPVRGHVQVRVLEVSDRDATLITVSGHPLAGATRFLTEARGTDIRFQVETYDRSASIPDLIVMSTVGRALKHSTWTTMVERVVERSGGFSRDGVQQENEALDEDQAARIEEWLEDLVAQRKRESQAPPARVATGRRDEASPPPA